MMGYFELQLGRLTDEQSFEAVYEGYEFLRDLPENPNSGTWKLMKNLAAGDMTVLGRCARKLIEELGELEGAARGIHSHPGSTPRKDMITEGQECLYWSLLPAVAAGTPYNAVDLPYFVNTGYAGKHPVDVSEAEYEDGMKGRPDEEFVIALRRVAVAVGKRLREYNERAISVVVLPRHVPDEDLRLMTEKPYMAPFLRERGLLPLKRS